MRLHTCLIRNYWEVSAATMQIPYRYELCHSLIQQILATVPIAVPSEARQCKQREIRDLCDRKHRPSGPSGGTEE